MRKLTIKSRWRWQGCSDAVVVVLLMMVAMWGVGRCFNVDIDTALVHQGEPGSMFGFSVAQHIDQSTHWLLVGAPQAQTSQQDVEEGGAVYRCRTDSTNTCQQIPFDQTGSKNNENKSHQWFGATVQSSGENGVIVACAPRYVYFSTDLLKREPVGTCYVNVPSTTENFVLSPCKAGGSGFTKQGSCQAGYSVSISEGGKKLLIGAVGSYYWQGQVFNYHSRETSQYISTWEGPAENDDNYLGYSSAAGKFDADEIDDYAVGVPRGAKLHGKVVLFTQTLNTITSILGEQVGSYFGSALAVSDLNKDGLDDIVIGAPSFSNFEGLNYDTGRVYVYYQSAEHEFNTRTRDILDGYAPKSRFGQALTPLGDINYDGYNDFAVGAPFGGKEGAGAVYVFHGSSKGVITQVSQVIEAKEINAELLAFGSSLSGGWDQDGNEYPDMIVGSYASDQAVFLKTRPVVLVHAAVIMEPKDINLEEKNCTLPDGTSAPCVELFTCMEYDGKGLPARLSFDVSWELDVLQGNLTDNKRRANFLINNAFSHKENNTYELTKGARMCTTSRAYVRNDLLDKLTPIAVDLKFSLHDEEPSSRRRRSVKPVLDQYIPKSLRTEAQILKECGLDNTCIPNLVLNSFSISKSHIINSKADHEIIVTVENMKEDAFNTKLYVPLPEHVTFRGSRNAADTVIAVACSKVADVVICDLGNPLPKGEKSKFTLRVNAEKTRGTVKTLKFFLVVNSTNPEKLKDTTDNIAEVEIPVTAHADISIYGYSDPEQLILNNTQLSLPSSDNGQLVEHSYFLQNLGPSTAKEIELQILWPSHDRRGNPMLEMEGDLQLRGAGSCNVLVITPENATKYGFARPGGSNVRVVLLSDQDEFEGQRRGDSVVLACTSHRCTVLQCIVGPLKEDEKFNMTIRSRFNVKSLQWRRDNAAVYYVRSSASARIKSFPYKLPSLNESHFSIARHSIMMTINMVRPQSTGESVEIWVIVLAVLGGLLLLLLLILLMWFCGFFKRKKPENEGYMVAGVTSANDYDNRLYD